MSVFERSCYRLSNSTRSAPNMEVEWVFPLGSETTVLIVVIGQKTQNQRDVEFTENVNYMKFFQQ